MTMTAFLRNAPYDPAFDASLRELRQGRDREGLIPEEVDVLRSLVDTQLRLLLQRERAKRGSTTEAT
jgi:type II secretory pathway predicted ATPase ExeA